MYRKQMNIPLRKLKRPLAECSYRISDTDIAFKKKISDWINISSQTHGWNVTTEPRKGYENLWSGRDFL